MTGHASLPGPTVLRVAKAETSFQRPCRDLVKYMSASSRAPQFSESFATSNQERQQLSFIAQNALGPGYIPNARSVRLPAQVSQLCSTALLTAQQSSQRKAKWVKRHPAENSKLLSDVACVMQRTDSLLASQLPPVLEAISQRTLHAEIKPKCMALPSLAAVTAGAGMGSSLLHPLKAVTSRFQMHQALKQSVKLAKGGGSSGAQAPPKAVSEYEPEDMGALAAPRLQTAVHCLLQTPQNNLRVWSSLDSEGPSRPPRERSSSQGPVQDGDDSADIARVLPVILGREALLMNLKALQRVCPWEEDAMAALQHIKTLPTVRQRMAKPPPGGIRLSALVNQDSVAPDLGAEDVVSLRRWLKRFRNELPAELVSLFCLGKTMKDVSLSVAMRRVQHQDARATPGGQVAIHPRLSGAPIQGVEDMRRLHNAAQTATVADGCALRADGAQLHTTDGRAVGVVHVDGCAWAYTLGLLDLDSKDPACIPYYYHQDAVITQVYLESIGAMPKGLIPAFEEAASGGARAAGAAQ